MLLYPTDIKIFSEKPEKHTEDLQKGLSLLNCAGATINPMRYTFLTNTINISSYVVRPTQLELASHTTDAIRGLSSTTSNTKLKSFFERCSTLRRFVPSFAQIASSPNQRLEKNQQSTSVLHNSKELNAKKTFRGALILPLVVPLPYSKDQRTLETGAYKVQTDCVLFQKQSNRTTKPVYFWPQSLTLVEQLYNTT